MKILFLTLFLVFLTTPLILAEDDKKCSELEISAKKYLSKLNDEIREISNRNAEALFTYATNVTDENMKRKLDTFKESAKFFNMKAREILSMGYQNIEKQDIKRQIRYLTKLGYSVLSENEYSELMSSISRMQDNYAKVKICAYEDRTKCDLSLEPEIEVRFEKSRDPEELKYYFKEWYNKAGRPVREEFLKYIELSRKAAKLNNFTSMAEMWIDEYEDKMFVETLDKIYEEILPFYKKLHAYVRYRLRQKYGDEIISEKGNIPIHLLGNLWGQSWGQIMDVIVPFPDRKFLDVTDEMKRQKYKPLKMFEMGDEFFQSMNMTKLPSSFYEKSVLEKPKDGREIICHASAYDMYSPNDVRIKQCTKVTMEDFYVVHHELGHIQYYLQYQNLPVAFRRAPNPGFHEAVGDVLALSVATPKHLKKVQLLNDYDNDRETRLNQLFEKAVQKLVFLPFSYSLDKYRYAVFREEIPKDEMNCAFWRMRSKYSGVEPAVQRSEDDFDPPAKYHVSADVEYLRYFTAHIFEFQFLKAACIKAGQLVAKDPLNSLDNCDIHGSTEAGNAFKKMLSLGASKHWKDALEVFTGEREMKASALLEYFEPLKEFLDDEIKRLNIPIGWEVSEKCKRK